MIDDIMEFILEVIFSPFESRLNDKVEMMIRKYGKYLRVTIKTALFLLSMLLIVGIYAVVNFVFTGHWL